MKHKPVNYQNIITNSKKHELIKLLIDSDALRCVNLLLFSDGEKQHYCWAKNLSRLLAAQRRKDGYKRVYCLRCFNHFSKPDMIDKHEEYCVQEKVVITLPKKMMKKRKYILSITIVQCPYHL